MSHTTLQGASVLMPVSDTCVGDTLYPACISAERNASLLGCDILTVDAADGTSTNRGQSLSSLWTRDRRPFSFRYDAKNARRVYSCLIIWSTDSGLWIGSDQMGPPMEYGAPRGWLQSWEVVD